MKIDPGERFKPSQEQDEPLVAWWDSKGGDAHGPGPGLRAQQVHRKMQRLVAAARKRLKETPDHG